MTGALLFLLLQSGKNRLLMRLRRMKQPKYLLGAIIGGLYFFQLFFARLFFHPRSHARPEGLAGGVGSGPEDLLLKASIGALMLFVVVVMTWVIPNKRAALVFSEAEVAFLFPAPVSRRTLVHFKLLKSQIAILFTALFVTLFFGWARSRGMLWTQALGWWVILSTLNLHQLGSSFARTMLLERGISNWKRRSVVLTSVVALVGGVAVWAWRTVPPPPRAGDIGGLEDIKYYVETVLQAGPLVYLLAPFRLVVQPYLAPDAMAFLRALVPALALLALHYVWVVRSNVAFEEASVEASRKMAERMAAARAGRDLQAPTTKKRRRPPFKLGATGFPPVAFLWKNLIGAGQAFTLRFWLLLVCIVLSVGMAAGANVGTADLALLLGMFALIFLGMSILMGQQFVRQDFRRELPMADVLKTLPLPGWQVALGELLAPAVILTAVQWCLLLLAILLSPKFGNGGIPWGLRGVIAFAIALIAPVFNLVSLVIPNAAVLLFPGWFQTGREGPQGIEATGQRLIFALGQLVVLVVALVPAGLVVGLITFVGSRLGAPVMAIPPAAVAAALVLAVEAGLGVMLLGKLFDRFDVSSESNPAG